MNYVINDVICQKLCFNNLKQVSKYLSNIEEFYKNKTFNLFVKFKNNKSIEYKNYKLQELIEILNEDKEINFVTLKENF